MILPHTERTQDIDFPGHPVLVFGYLRQLVLIPPGGLCSSDDDVSNYVECCAVVHL